MKTIKNLEFYRYGNTIVASYIKEGRLGVYSLAPTAQEFERNLPILAEIHFDRSGLAEKITRKDFMKRATERGVKELPLEIMTPKKSGEHQKTHRKKISESSGSFNVNLKHDANE